MVVDCLESSDAAINGTESNANTIHSESQRMNLVIVIESGLNDIIVSRSIDKLVSTGLFQHEVAERLLNEI